jgi:hypothetical protein
MKKLLLLLTILISIPAFSQTFEGVVTYKNNFVSKLPNVTNEQLGIMLGTELKYYIKGGDYKNSFNGNFLQYQLYINKDNKLYNKLSNNETFLWNDTSVETEEILKTELNKGVVEILGLSCDELVLTCKSGVQKYYFNTSLKIDASLYANHKGMNWAAYLSKSNAVPLKISVENQQFKLESVAIEIKPMALDSKIFELPAGATTAKSPY